MMKEHAEDFYAAPWKDPRGSQPNTTSVRENTMALRAVDCTFTNIGGVPRGSEAVDRRSTLKLEYNHLGILPVCP